MVMGERVWLCEPAKRANAPDGVNAGINRETLGPRGENRIVAFLRGITGGVSNALSRYLGVRVVMIILQTPLNLAKDYYDFLAEQLIAHLKNSDILRRAGENSLNDDAARTRLTAEFLRKNSPRLAYQGAV